MDNRIKHLEMIQAIITRMGQNSFMIKGWTITLVVAMFAFVPKTAAIFIPIAIVPVLIFAGLDTLLFTARKKISRTL